LNIDFSGHEVDTLFLESAEELECDYRGEYMKGGTLEDQDDDSGIESEPDSASDSDTVLNLVTEGEYLIKGRGIGSVNQSLI
jgi:hypothetical protein